jgi:Ca2+-binding RTX toxin-like protein
VALFAITWILLTTPIILGTSIASATTTEADDNSPATLTTPTGEPEQPEDPSPAEPSPEEQITITEEPSPLTASMNIDSTNGDTAPATFLFETEPEGGIEPYTFSWDFGDGSPQSNEQNTEHTFVNPGEFTVTLTVTDSAGSFVEEVRQVTVRPGTTTTTPTNVTRPTNVTTNQTETTGPLSLPPAIACPPGSFVGTPIELRSGGSGSIGNRDSLNQFLSGTTWSPAFIVSKEGAWANPIGSSQWISSDPGRRVPQSGDVWYRVSFTLPAGFSNPSLQGQIHVDNNAQIYLNPTTPLPNPNNQIGAVTGGTAPNFQDPPEAFATTANFVTGTNTLYFRVSNIGGPTGLDYQATVAYCQVVVDLPVERTCAEGIPTLVGTSRNDNLVGTNGPDFIAGRAGNDTIDGLGGDDILCGDEGDDTMRGGAGDDRIIGGADDDDMNGGAGDDGMWGQAGHDAMASDVGNDGLNGGADDDDMNGGAGDDVIDSRDIVMGNDNLDGDTHINGDFCIRDQGDTKVNCELGA